METIEDQYLVSRLPDDNAIRELYARHGKLVYSTCLNILRNRERAEDATQSVFLTLLAKAHELQSHTTLSGWLCVTAVRTSLSILKVDRRRTVRESLAQAPVRAQIDPLFFDLTIALSKLKSTDRDLLVLRFTDGLTYSEIGTKLEMTGDAARVRTDRVLTKLRQRFKGADLAAILPAAFSEAPSRPEFSAPKLAAKGWSASVIHLGPMAIAKSIAYPVAAAAVVAPLAITGVALQFRGPQFPTAATLGLDRAFNASTPLQATADSPFDVSIRLVTYEGGTRESSEASIIRDVYGQFGSYPIHPGHRYTSPSDLIFVPHYGKSKQFTCDLKLYQQDGDEPPTVGQELEAPIAATFSPTDGKTYYILVPFDQPGKASVYADPSEFSVRPEDAVAVAQLARTPGHVEDETYWITHMPGGPYDAQVVSRAPASATVQCTSYLYGRIDKTQTITASNSQPGKFSVDRPDGARSDFYVWPNRNGNSPPDLYWQYFEFRTNKIPGQKPDPSSGHGSMGGMISRLDPAQFKSWVISDTMGKHEYGSDEEVKSKDADKLYIEFKVVGIKAAASKP